MPDFRNIEHFRKGSLNKYPYQDPTYLSFALLFTFNDKELSPLLSGPAEDFIEKLSKGGSDDKFYTERLADLTTFIESLKLINREMPWYWESLGGLAKIHQHDPLKPYIGGDDAILEIETMESLNLPIAGLMHLYRRAIFDERKWTYILPKNLRKFKMGVFVTDVRRIMSDGTVRPIPNVNDVSATAEKKGSTVINYNAEIMGVSGRPFFATFLKYCEFDMTRGTAIFDTLTKNPEMAKNNIAISYEAIERIEARVLNGMISNESGTKKRMDTYLAPTPEGEALEAYKSPEEKKSNFFNRLVDRFKKNPQGNVYGDTLLERVASRNLDKLKQRGVSELRARGRERVLELQDSAINLIRGRKQSNENIFGRTLSNFDAANNIDEVRQAADVARAINDNVYGDATGISARDALDAVAAASINLGNVHE